jgi:hypothetical protein
MRGAGAPIWPRDHGLWVLQVEMRRMTGEAWPTQLLEVGLRTVRYDEDD